MLRVTYISFLTTQVLRNKICLQKMSPFEKWQQNIPTYMLAFYQTQAKKYF